MLGGIKPAGLGGAPFLLSKVLKMGLGTCGVQGMVLRYVGLFD